MRMREFIRKNKVELDESIKRICSSCRLNDEERERWILNVEGLYLWAKSEGVKV